MQEETWKEAEKNHLKMKIWWEKGYLNSLKVPSHKLLTTSKGKNSNIVVENLADT